MVHDVLSEIWMTKPETARRVRQRIGVVLDWAFSKGYRESELSMKSVTRGLPRQPKNSQHYAAMPVSDVSAFLTKLREKETMGSLALEFVIATAARSGEVRGAVWDEVDLESRLWTIPPERMKAGARAHCSAHRPCLPDHQALLATALRRDGPDFYGSKHRTPMSDMTLVKALRDMEEPFTPHGFRLPFATGRTKRQIFPIVLSRRPWRMR
jgi:integrase